MFQGEKNEPTLSIKQQGLKWYLNCYILDDLTLTRNNSNLEDKWDGQSTSVASFSWMRNMLREW